MKITIAQLNPTVGDIDGNMRKISDALKICRADSSDLLALSELFISGYPPRDLLERKWFIEKVKAAVVELRRISANYPDTGILLGAPLESNHEPGRPLSNSAILIYDGEIVFRQDKSLLPTYDVFDEDRYFQPANETNAFKFKDETLGISICEDAWNDTDLWQHRLYTSDPIRALAEKGATLFINIASSPFYIGKDETRFHIVKNHAERHRVPFIFVNQTGANDELIFDGNSMVVDHNGSLDKKFPAFEEHIETIDTKAFGTPIAFVPPDRIESVHDALVLGLRDYLRKSGFKKAVIGLSGGIDSAVVCALAVEAIGASNVLGVAMPSPYSAELSLALASKLAENLSVELKTIPINEIYSAYINSLENPLEFGREIDVTRENIQARIRGNILMAISNKFGHIVLSTGNKSELAVGYCTLYGDMSGGMAVISDVPKTIVYDLARFINRDREIIPLGIIDRPPTAELRENQLDQDTLPPYEILDEILRLYIDEGFSVEEIIVRKFSPDSVKWVTRSVDKNEYKRRQAAPGLKITSKAFGMGRRMPIAAKF